MADDAETALTADVDDADEIVARRDEILTQVTDHAGQIARELALLQGGDYGQETFETAGGSWTLKYEGGDVQYLRFDPKAGSETYVISTQQPPEPAALEAAMSEYAAFVEAYNQYVASFDGVLEDVSTTFPAVASTAAVVEERDRIVAQIRQVGDAMASELFRYEGEYGTYATTVSGTRWELKWDGERASYLRVGGSGGVYLLSQYEPPSIPDLRRYAPEVAGFVDAFNAFVEDLEADCSTVTFDP